MPKSNDQDVLLLSNLAKGDEKAFVEIYNKYWYRIFLAAYQRVRKKEVAEELVQNLFLKLWEKRGTIEIRQIENYLYTSIRHAVLDYIDAQLTVNNYLSYCKVFRTVKEETTQHMIALNEVSGAIEEGLTKLPQKSREVFTLSRLNHWSVEKIADHLHLSEKTVQYHLTKSLKFLRSYLKEFTYLLLCFFN